MYNRYRGPLERDGYTVGFRCVKLGTGEGELRLQLTDKSGTPFTLTQLQPRAGVDEYPDARNPRVREELQYADGVFSSKERFKNVAFVVVRNGDTVVARMPVEVFPDQVAVRKVNPNPAAEPSPVQVA